MKTAKGNSIVTIEWRTESSLFPVSIYLNGIDSVGTLSKVTEVISQQMNANIRKLSIESKEGLFEGTIQILVHSATDVESIRKGLRKISNIKTVSRKEE